MSAPAVVIDGVPYVPANSGTDDTPPRMGVAITTRNRDVDS